MPPEARPALERGLAPTDPQTLLLSVSRARAAQVSPVRVLRRSVSRISVERLAAIAAVTARRP